MVAKTKPVGETAEDRINWVIDKVKSKRTKDRESILSQEKSLNEKSDKAQDKNKVLEKSVTKIPDKSVKEEAPLSITEALQRTARRV
jgi:hypothetical protein